MQSSDEHTDAVLLPGAAPTPAPIPKPTWAEAASAARPPATPKARSRRTYAPPADPHRHAQDIAEAVIDTWFRAHGGSSIQVPIGTIAALILLRQPEEGVDVAEWVLSMSTKELATFLRETWAYQWVAHPDLIDRARPIHAWLEDRPDDHLLSCVRAVTHTALTRGLLVRTGSPDPYRRSEADFLGPLLTGLRHKSDKKARGEFHTPPTVCDAMAEVIMPSKAIKTGQRIYEPAAGTGGLIRAAAQRLRDLDHDPHDFIWFALDIDPTAAACCAVNAISWSLGPNVVVGCGNALARSTLADAVAHREAVIGHRNRVVGTAQGLALLDRLLGRDAPTSPDTAESADG